MSKYPEVLDKDMVGKHPVMVMAGGGYVWDEVLEYRVWCYPKNGAENTQNGDDYYFAFADFETAKAFADTKLGADDPLVVVLQREYIDEPEPGKYIHVKEERMAEWLVSFLSRPKRTERTIADFLSPDAPANRLDIIRGLE